MPFASTCPCGRPTYSYGGLCDRCVALQTLELPATATAAQIENSYRMLAKVWHPDRFQNDPKLQQQAEDKLKEINAAHEYLISEPAAQEPPRSQPRPKPPGSPEAVVEAPPEIPQLKPDVSEHTEFESDEVRRILKRRRRRFASAPRILLQAGIAVGAVSIVAILWLAIDAILMMNPKTAGPWEQYKAELGRDLHSTGLRMWSDATDNLHSQKDNGATAAPAQQPPSTPSPEPQVAANTSTPATSTTGNQGPPHIKVGEASRGAQPYVTSGLTPMEVLSILGTPTSSSGEKMFYRGSEIDFRNGHVAGWSVDPKSAPIRVKLWPTATPSPGLTQFAVGSSKNDVIALQGTPTLYSDNKFGYGNSVVLFKNDRVVGWQEDPNSVRLRVAH